MEEVGVQVDVNTWRRDGRISLGACNTYDLLYMLQMWQQADGSLHGPLKGDFIQALASIKASGLIMPSRMDSSFPPEDSAEEFKYLQSGELEIIKTVWGLVAGCGGGSGEDIESIKSCVSELLAREVGDPVSLRL